MTASDPPAQESNRQRLAELEQQVRQLRHELNALWRLTGQELEQPDPDP